MKIDLIREHNGDSTLLWFADYPGAFTRGATFGEALAKCPSELERFCAWLGVDAPQDAEFVVAEDCPCELNVADADSDVLFVSERAPLTSEEYERLKATALKSAADFLSLYDSVTDPDTSALEPRETFYGGGIPRTAREMYEHTADVNSYYFGEIGVDVENVGNILERRVRGFELLEKVPNYLANPIFDGSYGESWTLRKVLRRFVWHDRIHARAMWRMAMKSFGEGGAEDVFGFGR